MQLWVVCRHWHHPKAAIIAAVRCFHLLLLHCTQISVQRALERTSSKPVADSSVQVCQQALSERPLRQLSRGFPDGVIQTSCLNRAV